MIGQKAWKLDASHSFEFSCYFVVEISWRSLKYDSTWFLESGLSTEKKKSHPADIDVIPVAYQWTINELTILSYWSSHTSCSAVGLVRSIKSFMFITNAPKKHLMKNHFLLKRRLLFSCAKKLMCSTHSRITHTLQEF